MNALMLEYMVWFLLALAGICVIKLIIGPKSADRLVALSVLASLVLAILVLQGVRQERALYLDVALVYDIFGFLGFLAIAKFLKKQTGGEP